jgi:activating signal cointegrator complex subunit 2
MSGDDFLDGLVAAYRSMNPQLREAIIGMACLCLLGLGSGNTALLGDQLYALKTAADEHRDGPLRSEDSLVAQLVSETPILKKLRKLTQSHAAPASRQTILSRLDALEAYRSAGVETAARRKAGKGRTPSKGKGRAMIVDPGRSISGVRSATIAQLQEVFPDLGAGFIARLLDEYGDDADHAMSTLYEGLPEHLEDADKAESL